jgi:hypothetical protein
MWRSHSSCISRVHSGTGGIYCLGEFGEFGIGELDTFEEDKFRPLLHVAGPVFPSFTLKDINEWDVLASHDFQLGAPQLRQLQNLLGLMVAQ